MAELHPTQTANQLFGHLHAGDQVAITTRTINDDTQQYRTALEQKGLSVRIITNQTGVQDFCFLSKTKNHLVGTTRSTFVFWAGLLGNASSVTLYSLDYTKIPPHFGSRDLKRHTWKNTKLQDRVKFLTFSPE